MTPKVFPSMQLSLRPRVEATFVRPAQSPADEARDKQASLSYLPDAIKLFDHLRGAGVGSQRSVVLRFGGVKGDI
jgi:hypothetical protein